MSIENQVKRKVVIQCAGGKVAAPTFLNENGVIAFRSKSFFSKNILAPWSTISGTSTTWIDIVHEYNERSTLPQNISVQNDSVLINAADLYSNPAYRNLRECFGYESIFILSAGWGLVRGDTKIPPYDITFSNAAEGNCQITPSERVKYNSAKLNVGECDELHLFITRKYLEYWNLFFSERMHDVKNVILHWRKGQYVPYGNYSVFEHDCEGKTNWHYQAVNQFLSSMSPPTSFSEKRNITKEFASINKKGSSTKTTSLSNSRGIANEHTSRTKNDFSAKLEELMDQAVREGNDIFVITSKQLHQAVGGYPGKNHRMQTCCDVMYEKMGKEDVVLEKPPKGRGASLKIEYKLKNTRFSSCSVIAPPSQAKPGQDNMKERITVLAKTLRQKDNLELVPNDKPGWYKWWASSEALRLLLNSNKLSKNYYDEILPYLSKRNGKETTWHSLYVGVAIKESIRQRLNWHINQKHTANNVFYGTLSTLRQSISSLISGNQYDEVMTNKLIDMLAVEYIVVDFPIRSEKAKTIIESIEIDELTNKVYPLNIMDNKQPCIQSFKKELSWIRKDSK